MPITKVVKYIDENGFEFTFEPIQDTIKITEVKDGAGYEARYLISDHDAESPREWDNFGTMLCFHKRYDLGDDTEGKTSEDFNGWEEVEAYLRKEKKAVVVLPLYLYDHSGISMRTYRHGQHASWDCGQVGFIYITAEALKKEGVTKAKAEKILIGEVETYDQYLRGDCYTLVKETYTANKTKIDHDTLGGFYGYEYAEKSLATDI